MEQFEQLLTCAICLDRYRNPKLLPCQHSFCMEPCMDGLVDYVRRQVKCPECRAEHRIPYQGVQAFPTNVTLQRFLELHIEITGELPDPTSGQTMERCGVCSEKSYCSLCVHCDKKCCPECKDAHMDILRREITRINSQIRRGLHRLQDALALVEKNTLSLQTNCASVAEEVDEIYRRLSKALKDRTEHLRNEIDRYSGTELRLLIQLKENLELEIANIQSNCDLAEAHINENVPWDDAELLDTKELFLRTVEFIRNYEYELGDYGRRVRFVMAHEPNQLVLHVAGYGELNIKPETGSTGHLGTTGGLAPPGGSPGLMRSKSDHRLASQYRQEEERLSRNRYVPDYDVKLKKKSIFFVSYFDRLYTFKNNILEFLIDISNSFRVTAISRVAARQYDTPDYEAPRNKSRYRSRFMRQRDGEESDGDTRSSVRFSSSAEQAPREKVLYTEDAARGPISGIFRLTDSPRVMKKLQECERASKRKKDDPAVVTPIAAAPTQTQPPKTTQVQPKKSPAPAKQSSEDDEISRIKKQNKANPQAEAVEERPPATPTPVAREPETEDRRPVTRRTSSEPHTPGVRSASSDSSTGSESSAGSGIRSTGATFTTEEMKQKYLSRAPPQTTNTNSVSSTNPVRESASATTAPSPRPFQSRFLGNRATPPAPSPAPVPEKKKEEEDDDDTSSSSEETETETEESETDTRTSSAPATSERREVAMAKTDIGPLLARSAEARRGSKEESPSTRLKILASNEHYSSVPSIVITPDDSKLISVNHPDLTVSEENVNINNGTDNNNIKLDLISSENNQSDSANNQPEALTIGSYELGKMAAQNEGNWMLGSIKEEGYDEALGGSKAVEVSSDEIDSEEESERDVKAGSHEAYQETNYDQESDERKIFKAGSHELNSGTVNDQDSSERKNVKAGFHELTNEIDEQDDDELSNVKPGSSELNSETDQEESDDETSNIKAGSHEFNGKSLNDQKEYKERNVKVDFKELNSGIDSLDENNDQKSNIKGGSYELNSRTVNDEENSERRDIKANFHELNSETDQEESDDETSSFKAGSHEFNKETANVQKESERMNVKANIHEFNNDQKESNRKNIEARFHELERGTFDEKEGSKIHNEADSNELNSRAFNDQEEYQRRNVKAGSHEFNKEPVNEDEILENGQSRKMSPEIETEVSDGILTDTEDLGEILSSVIKSAKKMEQEYSLKHNPKDDDSEAESEDLRTYSKSNDSASEMSASFSTNVSDRIEDIFNRNSISEDFESTVDISNENNNNNNDNDNDDNGRRSDNRNIPMQMVTTVFCVSVLCYGVLTNLFLNKSRSQAAVTAPREREREREREPEPEVEPLSPRSRYAALKERRQRVARSRSSHNFGNDDIDLDEDPPSPTTQSPNAYLAAKYGAGSELARSRSTHALKSREPSPERERPGAEKDGAALSSWARYLKNKYGNRSTKDKEPTSTSAIPSSSASAASRRLSLGLPLRHAGQTSFESSDDDQKNPSGSPTSPTAAHGIPAVAGSSTRNQYLLKRKQLLKFGMRGSGAGCFTWPRGLAVGPDNSIVVADSSNHRVQVFDGNGNFVKEFGTYGSGEGEFDCLAGVAVNRIGQFIIADRYNHRIQVLDPSGRFLRAFGSQGTGDGRFNYPWGITTDALGFIYVCDKENHRVQVFQSDGTFVGKFSSCGSGRGQLEHPHYIAVSNTNRVIVSDSNNHRIQIFDVGGRVLTAFGSEGSDDGQFKFPRGVAVDDQGYIIVADSGNNRIQIFTPDGLFLRAFGNWGSGDAEFKGLEGVAVTSVGNIVVCDRENHRVQIF
ncbi:GSCOCG00010373001-RA-CDS [Cotesia congregata]|nr:GSCOCG00010373001-RA-CDS [Cotesia congregata]